MNRVAGRAGIVLILALLLMAGLIFFLGEYILEAGQWVIFPGSPHVYNGLNIGCGRVTDCSGQVLLDTTGERTYAEDPIIRKATLHWLGDRHGYISAPALSSHSEALSGFDLLNGVYSYGGTGGEARLTLSAKVQQAALEAMSGYKGTVAVYNYKTGQLLCAVTTPTYDPNEELDLEGDTTGAYEGVYLNRFTQSVYVPGSIFKIVTLSAAVESLPDYEDLTFTCNGSYELAGGSVTCESRHGTQTLKEAFLNSCNCAFAQLSEVLGAETLERYANQFGITRSVSFDGITTAEGNFDLTDAGSLEVAWSAIGQYTDQVNPCRYLTFMGAIASGGRGVEPYVVERISVGLSTTYTAKPQTGERIMSQATAEFLRECMLNNVQNKYGADNFPGLMVCAKTGTGEVDGETRPNAMFTGFVADEAYPLAFIAAIEDGGYGQSVCVPILSQVLAACKEVLDAE